MYDEAARFVKIRLQKRGQQGTGESEGDGEHKGTSRNERLPETLLLTPVWTGTTTPSWYHRGTRASPQLFRAGTDDRRVARWTLIELSQHPAVEDRLLKEIDQILASSDGAENAPPCLDKLYGCRTLMPSSRRS